MGSSLNLGPFRVLFIRVPYYFGNPKRDPNLENYPYRRFLREPTFTYQNLLFFCGVRIINPDMEFIGTLPLVG